MQSPLQDLRDTLVDFIDRGEPRALVLAAFDEEMGTIARVVDGVDGESPNDVVMMHLASVGAAKAYVDGFLAAVQRELAEVNEARANANEPPLAPFSQECTHGDTDPRSPYTRLQAIARHMMTWLPAEGDHRLVLALLPETITNQEVQAFVVGAMLALQGEPWAERLRVVLRDERRSPFLMPVLEKVGATRVGLHTAGVAVSDCADASAREAANAKVPAARRMQAFLQCAMLDVALGRYPAAAEKFGLLYDYYDRHKVIVLKTMVVQAMGDLFVRTKKPDEARAKYLQALDLASDAQSLPLICPIASSLGEVNMQTGSFVEAAVSFDLGAAAAAKLGNSFAQADLLERAGEARWRVKDHGAAVRDWKTAVEIARGCSYSARRIHVLERLLEVYRSAMMQGEAYQCEIELRAAKKENER